MNRIESKVPMIKRNRKYKKPKAKGKENEEKII